MIEIESTQLRRLEETIDWLEEGETRNWKSLKSNIY